MKQRVKDKRRTDFCSSGLPDWQRKIIEKYPAIYRLPHPNEIKESLPEDYCNLRSGFECGPGWQALIEQISAIADELVTKLKESGIQGDASIKAVVVKQK
jgi:hypothetical protein